MCIHESGKALTSFRCQKKNKAVFQCLDVRKFILSPQLCLIIKIKIKIIVRNGFSSRCNKTFRFDSYQYLLGRDHRTKCGLM